VGTGALSAYKADDGIPPEVLQAIVEWGGPLSVDDPRTFPSYACQRPSPLKHFNSHLTPVLEELSLCYKMAGDEGRELAFARAASTLRVRQCLP
jgi:hypothetical protein